MKRLRPPSIHFGIWGSAPKSFGRLQYRSGQPANLQRAISTVARPIFRKHYYDGSERKEQEIQEDELYKYTRCRWLRNDRRNQEIRYRKFNITALLEKAVNVVGKGAQSCVKVTKCIEGQFKKAFILTMDNGMEVVAKIPNPIAGPAFYTTASEVATRHFLRDILRMPVPRILTYDTGQCNPVQAEYIIEDKADGVQLESVWDTWSTEARIEFSTHLVDIQTRLRSIGFKRHGCIYYKKDLQAKGIPVTDLRAGIPEHLMDEPLSVKLVEQFGFGPLTEQRLWAGEMATMNLDRGPWTNPKSYMTAMGLNELQWAKLHAKPQMNPFRDLHEPVSPGEYISLLERYLQIVPDLAPYPLRTTLWHPCLQEDNIFVDPHTKKITSIIGWKSASVSPPVFQHKAAPIVANVSIRMQPSDLLEHYQNLTEAKDHSWCNRMQIAHRDLMNNLIYTICTPGQADLYFLRQQLIDVTKEWENITWQNPKPCPIAFTNEELDTHAGEAWNREGIESLLLTMHECMTIPLCGYVPSEIYEDVVRYNEDFLKQVDEKAESAVESHAFRLMWPYREYD